VQRGGFGVHMPRVLQVHLSELTMAVEGRTRNLPEHALRAIDVIMRQVCACFTRDIS